MNEGKGPEFAEVPEEAVEAVLLRRAAQGAEVEDVNGRKAIWSVLRPTVEADLKAAAPAIREQEQQRIREALREQAAECRREAEEAHRRGDQDGSKQLSSAADIVDGVTLIIFDFSEGPDA